MNPTQLIIPVSKNSDVTEVNSSGERFGLSSGPPSSVCVPPQLHPLWREEWDSYTEVKSSELLSECSCVYVWYLVLI